MGESLISQASAGLFCERGGFHLDPQEPVPLAVVSHAHGDHARPGSAKYLCALPSLRLLRQRLGAEALIEGVPYGERRRVGGVLLSFHPAGHMLGSAQIRVESDGEVWVFSGDFKREPDASCAPFEVVPCDVFITEATYALPIFRWDDPRRVFESIRDWWEANARAGRASVLFCYALGKAQRILAGLAELTERSCFVHGAIESFSACYREEGVRLLPTQPVSETRRGRSFAGELILAPITARGSTWMRRFGDFESAFASGIMRLRGVRRRRGFDRGFALSDHADFGALLRTIEECGARRVFATHGHREALVRFLHESGIDAAPLGAPPTQPPDPEGD